MCSFRTNGKRKQNKNSINAEEATQFVLDLPSDLDELSGDEGVNDFNEDENVYSEDLEHHSDTETESLRYCFFYTSEQVFVQFTFYSNFERHDLKNFCQW